jgi:hypothetical protein
MTFTPKASSGTILRSGEHADALASGGQARRQVGRQRGLPDAALPRADAQHVGDLRERAVGETAAPELLLERGLLRIAEHVEVDIHVGYPVESRDRIGDGGLEVAPDRTAGRGQGDGHIHDSIRAHVDRAHHVELDDRAAQLGVDHALQGVADLFSSYHSAHCGKSRRGPRLPV